MSHRQILASATLVLTAAALASGEFGTPASTAVREKLVGRMLVADGVPAIAANDEVGVFFKNRLVGAFVFTGSSVEFSMIIYGDDPTTTEVEGPKAGEKVEFRFFDASTNETRKDVRVENLEGEPFNYRYGGELNPFPDGLPIPIDLTPTREVNLRVGATQGGGGGGGGGDTAKYDVNGDGRIDQADVAMVLRMVIGASRGMSQDQITAADVTGDGRVDSNDAIAIMQNRP